MTYLEVPITTETEDLQDAALEHLAAKVPGWEAHPGNLEVWLIEAVAQMAAELAQITAQVPDEIFRSFGLDIAKIAALEAAQATAATTWTARDTLGHTIEAGTQLTIADVGFEVVDEVVIAPGVAATAAGGVSVIAIEPGEAANGLSTPAEPVDALEWVQTIAVVGSTSGGADAELDEDYRTRLSEELQLQSPRPIVPRDFEVLARRIAGVHRAMVRDGYNPAHNLLTLNQGSLETDTTGWEADLNATIARNTALGGADGVANLAITATGAGDTAARTLGGAGAIAVTVGGQYTALASVRPTVNRNVQVGIRWYDASNAPLSTTLGTSTPVTTGVWTQLSVTATAPALATRGAVLVYVIAAGASEVHHADKIAFRQSASTVWSAGGTAATDQERMVAIAAVGEDGVAVSAPIKTELDALLQSYREINFVVNVIDPTTTAVNVTFAAKCYSDWDPASVQANAIANVQSFLSPATWGQPPSGEIPRWVYTTTVRYLDVANAIKNTEGLSHITSLTVNAGTVDVTLPGAAPLVSPGTISGTVTLP